MAGRKAITIIIAVLLVTAITLASALSAFVFIQKTQRSAQGIAEVSAGNLLERFSTCGKIVSFNFNKVNNMSEAVLKNCGFRDIDLGDDNLWMTIKTQTKSCAFTLNSANCANCIGKLGIGSFVSLQINTSAVYCASTLADVLNAVIGQNVEVVISDKATSFSAATTFVPGAIVSCGIWLSQPANQSGVGDVFCYNYTTQNTGNAPDVFRVTTFTLASFQGIFNGSGCSGTAEYGEYRINIGVSETSNFSVKIDTLNNHILYALKVDVKSSNCAATIASYTTFTNDTG